MFRDLVDYWMSIHPDEGLPGRQHFDPLDVIRLSKHIWLLDVERSPLRFRVRRVGTELVKLTGRDITGRYLDECYENLEATEAGKHLTHTAEKGLPTYRRGDIISNSEMNYVMLERINLPLAADSKTVDMLLNLTNYLSPEEKERLGAISVIPGNSSIDIPC
jgi:hypothetical protein